MKPSLSILAASIALAALTGCGDTAAPPAAKAPAKDISNNSSGNPLTAPVDYLGAVAKGKKTAIKVVDIASVKQAIQMFKTEEDRFPKDLNELIAKQYIPALPAAPYQMKYQYNAANGDVKIVPAQ
jgi:predicted small lipoprotein YifL